MGSLIRRAGASCSIRRASSRLSCFVNRQPRGVVKIGIPRLEVTGFTRMRASARRPGRRPATWPSHPDKGVARLRGRVFPRTLSTALLTALSTALSLTKGHRSPAHDVFLSAPAPREGGAGCETRRRAAAGEMMAVCGGRTYFQTQRRFNECLRSFCCGNSAVLARGDVASVPLPGFVMPGVCRRTRGSTTTSSAAGSPRWVFESLVTLV